MTRRGRQKKEPFVRDKGTPELQAKRQENVGEGNDPHLSTSVLDMHLARQLINLEEHTICQNYQFYHRLVYGKPFVTSSLSAIGTVKSKIDANETKFDIFVKKHLDKIQDFIDVNASTQAQVTFMKICIFDIAPYYLLQKEAKKTEMYKEFKKFLRKLTKFMDKSKKN